MNLQPLLSKEKKDAKSLIVGVLSKDFPLQAKHIYSKIRNENPALSLTYQGIHKAIKQLEDDDVVLRLKNGYRMSPNWIASILAFGKNIKSAYSTPMPVPLQDMAPNQSMTIQFGPNSMLVEPYYWGLEHSLEIKKIRRDPFKPAFAMHFAWPLTVLSDEKYKQFHELFYHSKGRIICQSHLKADKALLKLWEPFGFEYKLGVKLQGDCDLIAIWDYAFQYYHPPKMLEQWKALYEQISESSVQDFSPTHKVAFEVPTLTTVVVTRNQLFADNIREQVNKHFVK